jgi:ubiquinone biosynthesis monooxygenase Coq7
MVTRDYSLLDRLISRADRVLGILGGANAAAGRPTPAEGRPEARFSPGTRRDTAGLVRVDHTGEVCAQALYLGQALVARDPGLAAFLCQAAREEVDHLHWCRARLEELESQPSRLNPAWFGGALLIGMASGLAGDDFSLGFLDETERQVVAHLDGHLERLQADDARSRAILDEMKVDEARHAENAVRRGARDLPMWAVGLMRLQAKVMTTLAYRL